MAAGGDAEIPMAKSEAIARLRQAVAVALDALLEGAPGRGPGCFTVLSPI
jgi:hypothetical protein